MPCAHLPTKCAPVDLFAKSATNKHDREGEKGRSQKPGWGPMNVGTSWTRFSKHSCDVMSIGLSCGAHYGAKA